MFNKILVAIDRSAGNKQVFEQALSLAKADASKLLLLQVLSIEEPGSPAMFPYLIQR